MKFRWDTKYLYWGLTAFLVIVLSISFFITAYNVEVVAGVISKILQILKPFIIGLVLAYLLNPILDYFEKKVVSNVVAKTKVKKQKALSRVISMIITFLLAIAFLCALFSMVIPQLIESIKGIVNNLSLYATNLEQWISNLLSSSPTLASMLTEEFNDINGTIITWAKNNLLPQLDNIIGGVTTSLIGVVVLLKDLLVGLIISIYVLFSKELFFAQTKKFLYAVFPMGAATTALTVTRRSHRIFGKFIIGKLIDSFIIGVLCFLCMTLFKMPYPLLISVIIGITNIIPFFGPFIGAIPSALLILMIDPLTCLYFIIFILALQQFDGNILGPKILGDSTGLSAFWVIFAILLGGGLFGFPGMIVGVPAFAVIYSLIVEWLNRRLERKDIPSDIEQFYKLHSITKEDKVK